MNVDRPLKMFKRTEGKRVNIPKEYSRYFCQRKSNRVKPRKMVACILVIGVLLYVYGGKVKAETTMTLDDCLKSAIENNKQLRLAKEKVTAARYKKKEAFGSYLPNLSVTGAYLYNHEINKISFLDREIELGARKSYLGRLNLTQPLYLGGKIFEANRQADIGWQLAMLDYEKQKDDLVFQVKQNFYTMLLAQQMVSISQAAYDVTAAHLKVSQGLYEEGKLSSYEVSRVKVQLANQKTTLLRAKNNYQLSVDALFNLLGGELSPETNFAGQLGYVEKPEKDYPSGLSQALQKRIEIRQLLLQEKISDSLVSLARSDYYPNIVVNSTFSRQNSSSLSAEQAWTNSWTTTLSVTMPLFEGLTTNARINQAKSQKEQILLTKALVIDGIKIEIKQAYFTYEQAKENLGGQGENVDTAKTNLQTAQERYKLGLMSDIEVRDAELSLTQAETNFYQAIYEYLIAQAKLEKAIGATL